MIVLTTPIGKLGISTKNQYLTGIHFLDDHAVATIPSPSSFQKTVIKELMGYFKNPRSTFTIAYQLNVTTFQKKVLDEMKKIPSGQTRTYGELAKTLKTSPRAIGNACRSNPIPIIIPCHRVVAQHHLGGFSGQRAGKPLEIKRWLLQQEDAL